MFDRLRVGHNKNEGRSMKQTMGCCSPDVYGIRARLRLKHNSAYLINAN